MRYFTILIFVISFFCHIFALKCFQGTINTANPINSTATATDCPAADDVACIMRHDAFNKTANFMCVKTNCTLNGMVIRDSSCINTTTSLTNCCCHGDGCNSVYLSTLQKPASPVVLPPPIIPSNTSVPIPVPINKPVLPPMTTMSKDQIIGGCDKDGFKILSTTADATALTQGKFAGYLISQTSCQELCKQSYGLFKCVSYMFESKNRGKCSLFQLPINEKIVDNPISGAFVSTKCT
uniref:Apple domain-containing protein n=1 Tax=Panagrolaimus sp. ES5 TaxID=591445 RepID=A0AC34FKP2_9BILA